MSVVRSTTLKHAASAPRRSSNRPALGHIQSFQTLFAAYLSKTATLDELRAVIKKCVANSCAFADVIRHSCLAAFEAGYLDRDSYQLLLADVHALMTRYPAKISPPPSSSVREAGVGRVLRNRFEIQERVATGGIGVLYLAVDRHRRDAGVADPAVVVKLLGARFRTCPDAIRSLQCEARNARHLMHPNIRTVYDLDRSGGDLFITMEWLRGESLANRLDRTAATPMPFSVVSKILLSVAAGLEHAHDHGIVHGDIKPGNVFLTSAGNIKLLDFGQSLAVESKLDPRIPMRRAISPAYASCELHEAMVPAMSDDLFGLAVMAYRMLSGVRPFGRATPLEAEQAGLCARRPGGLSDRQWGLLQQGLAFRREQRPAHLRTFVDGLLQIRSAKRLRRDSRLYVAA